MNELVIYNNDKKPVADFRNPQIFLKKIKNHLVPIVVRFARHPI